MFFFYKFVLSTTFLSIVKKTVEEYDKLVLDIDSAVTTRNNPSYLALQLKLGQEYLGKKEKKLVMFKSLKSLLSEVLRSYSSILTSQKKFDFYRKKFDLFLNKIKLSVDSGELKNDYLVDQKIYNSFSNWSSVNTPTLPKNDLERQFDLFCIDLPFNLSSKKTNKLSNKRNEIKKLICSFAEGYVLLKQLILITISFEKLKRENNKIGKYLILLTQSSIKRNDKKEFLFKSDVKSEKSTENLSEENIFSEEIPSELDFTEQKCVELASFSKLREDLHPLTKEDNLANENEDKSVIEDKNQSVNESEESQESSQEVLAEETNKSSLNESVLLKPFGKNILKLLNAL